jgi:hypothetical protein
MYVYWLFYTVQFTVMHAKKTFNTLVFKKSINNL